MRGHQRGQIYWCHISWQTRCEICKANSKEMQKQTLEEYRYSVPSDSSHIRMFPLLKVFNVDLEKHFFFQIRPCSLSVLFLSLSLSSFEVTSLHFLPRNCLRVQHSHRNREMGEAIYLYVLHLSNVSRFQWQIIPSIHDHRQQRRVTFFLWS